MNVQHSFPMQSTDFRKSAAISCQIGPTQDTTTHSAPSASSGCGWQAGDPERRNHYGKSAGWDYRTENGSGAVTKAARVSTVFLKKNKNFSKFVLIYSCKSTCTTRSSWSKSSQLHFFSHRQDIKELKEELNEERSKRTALQVSGHAFTFKFLKTPCLYSKE